MDLKRAALAGGHRPKRPFLFPGAMPPRELHPQRQASARCHPFGDRRKVSRFPQGVHELAELFEIDLLFRIR